MTRFTFLYSIVVTFSMDLVGDDFFEKMHFSFCIFMFSKCTTFSTIFTLKVTTSCICKKTSQKAESPV